MDIAAIILAVALLYTLYRFAQFRKRLYNLANAVEERANYLNEDSSDATLKGSQFDRLRRACRALIDENRWHEQSQNDQLSQIESTLDNMREAVLIADHSHRLVSANASAIELLEIPEPPQGRRLESFLKTPEFLEMMPRIKKGENMEREEISIESSRGPVWFEVSGTMIPGESSSGYPYFLFVLHDITRLKRLENIRKEFVANVSHELRTPVTVIKGFTDALLNDHENLPVEARQRFLEKIHRNVERFHRLLEDLLALSRLEANNSSLNLAQASLKQIILETRELYEDRLAPEQLVIDLDPDCDSLRIDHVKIAQVFSNLIDNSLMYAKGFTHLYITSRRTDDNRLRIVFEDNGCGIPKADMAHIFERFYRVDKGRSRESGGTGLGLSIVKHTIQLHGGTVLADSSPGNFTRITFYLPLPVQG